MVVGLLARDTHIEVGLVRAIVVVRLVVHHPASTYTHRS